MEKIQEKVRWLFYRHGLFCASHPFAIISLVITIAFITCYPLTNIPLPGNAPLMYTTLTEGYKIPQSTVQTPSDNSNEEDLRIPRWYVGSPEAYVQQLIIKSAVFPWDPHKHIQTDAFRQPIQQVFDIIEIINNFKYQEGENEYTVSNLCLRVAETKHKRLIKGILPEYNCLVVSPANLWNKDKLRFQADGDIIKTIFKKYSPPILTPPYLKDILFGVSHQDSGVKKYFVRNRQRVISYAITMIFKEYNPRFIAALKEHLHSVYPLSNSTEVEHMTHVYYKDLNYFVEYTPLLVTYAVLFLYIYFSVRKIEMVKSKWGLAFSAVVTVIASLLMSVSICLLFGLTPSLNGSEIFPYLVVIVGLENVLVVTKSVVSTPVYLDVKLRVAQGISKEGWFIFKYMVTELLILAVGFLTFVPAIQEFCAFAVVGLLTDFFLQMFFFTTVLSIDIRRMELSDLHKQGVQQALHEDNDTLRDYMSSNYLMKSRNLSALKLQQLRTPSPMRINKGSLYNSRRSPSPSLGSYMGDHYNYEPPTANLPRRVKFLNFWARTRVVQKTVMVCVVIWILLIVYKAGIVAFLTQTNGTIFEEESIGNVDPPLSPTINKLLKKDHTQQTEHNDGGKSLELQNDDSQTFMSQLKNQDAQESRNRKHKIEQASDPAIHINNDISKILKHDDKETWKRLSYKHWPILFGFYNKSLDGKYITVLPSLHLSVAVTGESAVNGRHPNEHKLVSHLFQYYNAAMFYGHTQDTSENESYTIGPNRSISLSLVIKRISVYPRNTVELILTILCCIASLVLFFYFMVFLYKCMCPKNYSQWRASWYKSKKGKKGYYKQIRETLPLHLEGHKQEIECITTDGPLIISTCLGGFIKVWDANSGECLSTIVRRSSPPSNFTRNPIPGRNVNDSDADLYAEYHGESFHKEYKYPSGSSPAQHYTGSASDLRHINLGSSPAENYNYIKRQHSVTGLPNASSSKRVRQNKHTRFKSADLSQIQFEDIAPDLSSLIDTDFTALAKEQKEKELSSAKIQQNIQNDYSAVPFLPKSLDSSGDQSSFSINSSSFDQSNLSDMSQNDSNQFRPLPVSPVSKEIPIPVSPSNASIQESTTAAGYDFGRFLDPYYKEHAEFVIQKKAYMEAKRSRSGSEGAETQVDQSRTFSFGESPKETDLLQRPFEEGLETTPAVWCLCCQQNLIIAGCGNGRIEFWDGLTGQMKCHFSDNKVGVTAICFVGNKITAARLNGTIDFLEIETFVNLNKPAAPTTHTSLHNRGHVRQPSSSSLGGGDFKVWDDVIHCNLVTTAKAHQRPINLLHSEGGRVVSASQDHTLKVYRLEDSLCLYTLYGHNGSVTALHLDRCAPLAAASGAEDGTVRLWDLFTGACVHKLHGHTATVTNLTCTPTYVISVAVDDRLCIWERSKGALLHWVQMDAGFCNSVAMLTSNLMVSGGQGCLYLWDVYKGEILRTVQLGDLDHSVFVKQIHVIANAAVVCDYGNQLRVVHFPSVLEKAD